MIQVGGALPRTPWELIAVSTVPTKIVLVVLGVFSAVSWFLIVLKFWQFRRVRRQGSRLFKQLETANRLEDVYAAVVKLPPSPYGRLLREGVNFFSEIRPGALHAAAAQPGERLSGTQLEVLRLMLAKEIGAERDLMARFIPWLATFGSVSPLLGLLGTVVGVIDAFLGIATGGSGNISAVAPGISEALVATVAGLGVAIPSVMAYNILVSRLSLFTGELEGFAYEIIGTMAREGRI
jgi:biopolymer transport protein TolQ